MRLIRNLDCDFKGRLSPPAIFAGRRRMFETAAIHGLEPTRWPAWLLASPSAERLPSTPEGRAAGRAPNGALDRVAAAQAPQNSAEFRQVAVAVSFHFLREAFKVVRNLPGWPVIRQPQSGVPMTDADKPHRRPLDLRHGRVDAESSWRRRAGASAAVEQLFARAFADDWLTRGDGSAIVLPAPAPGRRTGDELADAHVGVAAVLPGWRHRLPVGAWRDPAMSR